MDLECSAKLLHSFSHARHPNTRLTNRNSFQSFVGNASPIIADAYPYRAVATSNGNTSPPSPGVSMNVSQTLLNNTEDGCFDFSVHSPEF